MIHEQMQLSVQWFMSYEWINHLSYLGIIFLKWKKFTTSESFSVCFHIKNLDIWINYFQMIWIDCIYFVEKMVIFSFSLTRSFFFFKYLKYLGQSKHRRGALCYLTEQVVIQMTYSFVINCFWQEMYSILISWMMHHKDSS